MASDTPHKKDAGEPFDVVLVHGATVDGKGARVLRARPGQVEAGEVRPLREGQPIAPGGEIVRLVERADSNQLYDVKVDYTAHPSPPAAPPRSPPLLTARAGTARSQKTAKSDRAAPSRTREHATRRASRLGILHVSESAVVDGERRAARTPGTPRESEEGASAIPPTVILSEARDPTSLPPGSFVRFAYSG